MEASVSEEDERDSERRAEEERRDTGDEFRFVGRSSLKKDKRYGQWNGRVVPPILKSCVLPSV